MSDGWASMIDLTGDESMRERVGRAPTEYVCGWCGGPQHNPSDCAVAQRTESQRLCDEALAGAWDEGFEAQCEQSYDQNGKPTGVIIHNPYRPENAR